MTYQRFMNGMSNGGAIQARSGEVLSNDELRRAVPSLFAETAHESRSDKFVPIPTVRVLDSLRAADFQPVMAQQARTRIPGKQDYTRHMLRLRHRSLTNAEGRAFEVILVNANDGTAAYKMMAGIFRFVCTNGLFTGDTFAPVHVRHSGKDVIQDVRDGAHRILEMAPRVLDMVDEFKATHVTRDDAEAFAAAAHLLRFPKAYDVETDENGEEVEGARPVLNPDKAPIQPIDLLRPKRSEDKHPTLWHALNIIQENAVKGGQRGHIIGSNGKPRRARVQQVKGIQGAEKLNRDLWTLAEALGGWKKAESNAA